MILFCCKTTEAHVIKCMAEVLQNNIKNSYFEIDKSGIRLKMTDTNKSVLIDLVLNSDNFTPYIFNNASPLYIGFNQIHLYKMLKSVKKKDSLELFIDDEKKNDLGIRIFTPDSYRVTTSYIKTQTIQHIDIDVPTGYDSPISIRSSDFQKMCKDMNTICKTISVVSTKFTIKFTSSSNSIFSKEIVFGDSKTQYYQDLQPTEISQEFNTERLCRISKISGLTPTKNANSLKIYQKEGLPLLLVSPVGTIGSIYIYIKSQEQIEEDEKENFEE